MDRLTGQAEIRYLGGRKTVPVWNSFWPTLLPNFAPRLRGVVLIGEPALGLGPVGGCYPPVVSPFRPRGEDWGKLLAAVWTDRIRVRASAILSGTVRLDGGLQQYSRNRIIASLMEAWGPPVQA